MGFWVDAGTREAGLEYGPGDEYGYFHRADRSGGNYLPGVLVLRGPSGD